MTILIATGFAILGAILGSFIGVVAERAFTGQSWKHGRSRCNSCRRFLTARDLIPVVSWLFHRGRCRTCGSRVPYAYALYELTLGALFALAYVTFGLALPLFFFLPALLLLAFIVIYDLRHTIVPPAASYMLIVLSLLFAYTVSPTLTSFHHTLAYAIGVAVFFFSFYALSRGRAMGLGDTPASFALALLAGPAAIPGLFFSFWIGGIVGVGILVFRKGGPTMGIEVPFVPFMAAGFLLALFTQWNPLPFLF